MSRILLAWVIAAACAAGQGGIEPPVTGQVRDAEGRLIRILGAPGAWQTEEASEGTEWLERGWRVESGGTDLTLVRESNGERYVLPRVASNLQLTVFVPPDQEMIVNTAYAFPLTAAGDSAEVRLRVRNIGTAAVEVNRVFIAPGGPFKVSNAFPIPRTLTPGGFGEVRVSFSPAAGGSFSGELRINDTTWILTGSSTVQAELETYDGQAWIAAPAGGTVDFGRIAAGQEVEKWFRLTLPPAAPPRIAGAGFTLALFGEGFRITCRPPAPGQYSGTLSIGSRNWVLKAAGEQEIPPRPSLLPAVSGVESGAQHKVSVVLDSPASAALTGTLRLEFEPENSGLGEDASTAFVPSLSRSIGFTVKQGESQAEFVDGREAVVQTGSTAGWIVLKILLGPHQIEQRIRVAPAPVRFDSSTAARSPNVAEIVLKGLDNTRTAKRIAFRFYRSGGTVAGEFDIDVEQAFRDYYSANPKAGGVFQLRAQFPISGDSTLLESVDVTLTNQTGVSEPGRLRF